MPKIENIYNIKGRQDAYSKIPLQPQDPNIDDEDYMQYKEGYLSIKSTLDALYNTIDHSFLEHCCTKHKEHYYEVFETLGTHKK